MRQHGVTSLYRGDGKHLVRPRVQGSNPNKIEHLNFK